MGLSGRNHEARREEGEAERYRVDLIEAVRPGTDSGQDEDDHGDEGEEFAGAELHFSILPDIKGTPIMSTV